MTPTEYTKAIAAEVRAEMGRQSKTKVELATALGITPATAATRLSGAQPFDVFELAQVALWLNVPVENFARTAPSAAAS